MKQNSHAFTLIELLVVVLIIGILASVALPQYQKAVKKSRAVEALTTIRSTVPAIEEYILANGEFPTSWDQLSVTRPTDRHYNYILIDGRLDVGAGDKLVPFLWFSQFAPDVDGRHRLFCYYIKEDTDSIKQERAAICKSLGGGTPQIGITGSTLFPLD